MFDYNKPPCNCDEYLATLHKAGLTDNGRKAPPPACKNGYNIAVSFSAAEDCDEGGARHFRREERDGRWKELFGCKPPEVVPDPDDPSRALPPRRLSEDITLPDGTKIRFCGFVCRQFGLGPTDLIHPTGLTGDSNQPQK